MRTRIRRLKTPPTNNKRTDSPTGRLIPIIAGTLLSLPLAAQEWRLGLLDHDTGIGRTRIESGADANIEWLGPHLGPSVLGLDPRPFAGLSGRLSGDSTDQVYGGLAFDAPVPPFVLTVGLGLAVHNGDLDRDSADRLALGSRVLFYASVEAGRRWGRHGLFGFYQHSSNGPISGPNGGINNLGLRYGYRY